jgi:hypothetical protein
MIRFLLGFLVGCLVTYHFYDQLAQILGALL